MKVIVCGGRNFHNEKKLYEILDKLHDKYLFTRLAEGDADGADRLAGYWAEDRGIPLNKYPADWNKHGNRAGYIRNAHMLHREQPDLLIAFPGGPGTAHMVASARKAGVKIVEIRYRGEDR